MTRRRSSLFLPLLLSSFLLVGCEPGSGPTAPEPVVERTVTMDQYTRVQTSLLAPLPKITSLIGSGGGTLELLDHVLSIPAGAVAAPTLFVMTQLPTGYVEVELLALSFDPFRGLRDVGSGGFLDGRTVRLTLSYAGATNVDDPSRLRILRVLDGGVVEPLASTVDTAAETVSVELEHFSRYCMAMD